MEEQIHLVGFGKSMHRFMPQDCSKPCTLGGVYIEESPGFSANTDGDVLFEAIAFAIESISSFRLYETVERYVSKEGITDSEVFFKKALEYLKGQKIINLALLIEGKAPWLTNARKLAIQEKISKLCSVPVYRIGITHISADGLNECGLGSGLSATALINVLAVSS